MAQLKAKDLCLGYEGNEIVHQLNFEIDSGDYVCIIGENGSGKSTLIRTILGLQAPMSGTIESGDGLSKTQIGYLPQQTQIQRDFPATVSEIVISGFQGRCGLRPFYTKDEKRMAAENMEKMGITHLRFRCYRELSGGQQQRVLLARALCATQKMLLLDEPVSGLDPKATAEMYGLIKSLNRDGITVIMVTHDISALENATKVLHIGNRLFFGTKEEYNMSDAAGSFGVKGGDGR